MKSRGFGSILVVVFLLSACAAPVFTPHSQLESVQQLTALSATLTEVVAENVHFAQTPTPVVALTATLNPTNAGTQPPLSGRREISDSTLKNLQLLAQWDAQGINKVAFSPDSSLVAAGQGDYWNETGENVVQLWMVSNGNLQMTLHLGGQVPNQVVFSPDGQRLAALSENGWVYIWNLQDGSVAGVIEEKKGYLTGAAFSLDGAFLAVGVNIPQKNGLLRIWNLEDISLQATYEETYGRVNSPVFSVSGAEIATTSKGMVRIWRVADGKILRSLEKDTAMVNVAAFSPDGKLLASGSHNGLIQIWGAEKGSQHYGERLQVLEHHNDNAAVSITGLSFSTDSRLLLSAGVGGVRFWDAHSGEMLYTMGEYAISPYSAVFSPDGFYLALAEHTGFAGEGSLQIWGVP